LFVVVVVAAVIIVVVVVVANQTGETKSKQKSSWACLCCSADGYLLRLLLL